MIWYFAGQASFQLLDVLQVSVSLSVVQQLIRCDQASTAEHTSRRNCACMLLSPTVAVWWCRMLSCHQRLELSTHSFSNKSRRCSRA